MKLNFHFHFCQKVFFSFFLVTFVKSSGLLAQTSGQQAQDNLIVQISVKSGKTYPVKKLNPGEKQFSDRSYTITSLPEYLQGASFIQTANDDKLSTADQFLSFFLTADAVVYVAYDPRGAAIPEWLTQWTNTGDSIGTSDQNVGYLNIYSKAIQNEERFYPVILGGNLASPATGAKTNYLLAAIKRPGIQQLQAEDAFLSGPVAANNHGGYDGTGFVDFKNPANDYIEWTVQIDVPGSYKLDFGYANASSRDRSLQITDNGINIGTATFTPVSSSWSEWSFLNGANAFFTPGIHKIRLTATGTSGPNLDELYIYYLYADAPFAATNNYLPKSAVAYKSLLQAYKAYPNPFFKSAKIQYTISEKAQVNLSVYTLQGQQIQVVENSMREAGNYQVTFDGSRIAKGIYLYRLQIGNNVKTGKLIKE